jgi:hypothetical protein
MVCAAGLVTVVNGNATAPAIFWKMAPEFVCTCTLNTYWGGGL